MGQGLWVLGPRGILGIPMGPSNWFDGSFVFLKHMCLHIFNPSFKHGQTDGRTMSKVLQKVIADPKNLPANP